jgi:predicted RNase H-like HicB family nuclease
VECPSLPGCVTQGKTRQETLENIREATELYIETLVEDERPIPLDTIETELRAAGLGVDEFVDLLKTRK